MNVYLGTSGYGTPGFVDPGKWDTRRSRRGTGQISRERRCARADRLLVSSPLTRALMTADLAFGDDRPRFRGLRSRSSPSAAGCRATSADQNQSSLAILATTTSLRSATAAGGGRATTRRPPPRGRRARNCRASRRPTCAASRWPSSRTTSSSRASANSATGSTRGPSSGSPSSRTGASSTRSAARSKTASRAHALSELPAEQPTRGRLKSMLSSHTHARAR